MANCKPGSVGSSVKLVWRRDKTQALATKANTKRVIIHTIIVQIYYIVAPMIGCAITNSFDREVVVVGGGHAGIEAAHAAWRLGARTTLLTMEEAAIGRMSCNPAIGGVAKGQIVREIDALGGVMGLLADAAGIQFRVLNASKGPAVWGPRAQCDMALYSQLAREILHSCNQLQILQCNLEDFTPLAGGGFTLRLSNGKITTRTLVITSGTFLAARMFTGEHSSEGGRIGEPASQNLSRCMQDLGIAMRRLKTGTPARLHPHSINFADCQVQEGDAHPLPFSDRSPGPLQNSAVCWITRTTGHTHNILRQGFARSPMFSGVIKGVGPRYCPSIEDKVNRFGERDSHQLFLEPEGLGEQARIYVNGFSSSLPAEVQEAALRSIAGLEKCKILQIGYAVEYNAVDATQLHSTLEMRKIPGLYFAGQVCGTSGYEEAAGQGLVAGANAALAATGRAPLILGRADSYLGVMLDDLVHNPLDEPYRMFTSRAEYRLFLRQDNAGQRLSPLGRANGLVGDAQWKLFEESTARLQWARSQLAQTLVQPEQCARELMQAGQAPLTEPVRALGLLRRPHVEPRQVLQWAGLENHRLLPREATLLWAEELYAGFFVRQEREIADRRRLEGLRLPPGLDYSQISGLSTESRLRLQTRQPLTVGEVAGTPGIRPTDVSALVRWLAK